METDGICGWKAKLLQMEVNISVFAGYEVYITANQNWSQ